MNVLKNKNIIKKDKNVKVEKYKNRWIITNTLNKEVTLIVPKIYKVKKDNIEINFYGKVLEGEKGILVKLVNRSGKVVTEAGLNTDLFTPKKTNFFMVALRIMPYSKVEITKLNLNFIDNYDEKVKEGLGSDTIIIVPGYPSISQKYNFSFVHSKVIEYYKRNFNVDVLVVNSNEYSEKYKFEEVNVTKTDYLTARNILQEKKYKNIIVHFFMEEYANLLDAVDTSKSRIFIYSHGADIIYRDYNKMTTKYFNIEQTINAIQEQEYKRKDKILERYNKKTNVKWIFGTDWAKNRAEKLNNIKFKNCEVIPCIIDEKIFKYNEKNMEDRKKIFTIKKFDNVNTYSIDIMVRTIIELSKRECFKQLEFNIYGDGTEHERLLKPLQQYKNVNIYKGFLSHNEIAKIHKENGIGLFPTRYETQGVSALEAAMSGLVVITGNVAAVPEVFDNNSKILCETENYIEYANKIEELFYNPEEFCELSEQISKNVCLKFDTDKIIQKEINMLNSDDSLYYNVLIPEQEEVILTIAIASYNVEKYLINGVLSLINSDVASNLEILIINDGSKDNTAEIGKKLEKLTKKNGKSIVKLVDKENGGHGSTINKGIELATGKYFKLMDGDDYFDTETLERLVRHLKNENVDMVLNNYVEDLAVYSKKRVKSLYNFMVPGIKYDVEDLCDEVYGFQEWGPLLSTSTYRTQMLKDGKFSISEKCFYVDMELNTYAFINAKTIKYYPLDIYIYYIGRAGQSVSRQSYAKNYKNHEHVTLKLIDEFYNNKTISEEKKKYIKNKIVLPLIKCQYMVVTEFLNNNVGFNSFDKKLKKYPELYKEVKGKKIILHRVTKGHTIRILQIYESIMRRLRKS